jgi:hypothetical protein
MTHRYEIAVVRHARATPQTLFDVLADGSRWSEWARPLISYSAWETRGPGDDGGVGAIRAVGARQFPTREMTTIHEPGYRHGYTILADKPVQNYQAEVTLTEDGDRTRIDWHGSFDTRRRAIGLAYRAVVGYVLRTLADKLVAEAERRDAASHTT